MVSKIDICNLALAQLGQAPIASLKQEDERAKRLDLFYEPVRDEVLRTHNWGFATAEIPLSLLKADPQTGLFYYQYPPDALFIQRVYGENNTPGPAFEERYEAALATRVIVTKIPYARAIYTRKTVDETQFDAAFVKVFSLALACDCALALTGDASLAMQLTQKYTLCLDEARRSNMTENCRVVCDRDAFSEVR